MLTYIAVWVYQSGDLRWFAGALALTAVVSIMIILPGLVVDPGTRQYGAYRHISMMGTGGFALVLVGLQVRPPFALVAVAGLLLIVASVTRAPVVALAPLLILVLWQQRNEFMGFLIVVAVGAALVFIAGRMEPAAVLDHLETRAATAFDIGGDNLEYLCDNPRDVYNDPDYVCEYGNYSFFGTGAAGYLDRFTWPRPHNIYSILAFEYGVLALIPVSLFVWIVKSRRLPWSVAMAILLLGLLDDSALSQRESPYLCAIVLVASWRVNDIISLWRPPLRLPNHTEKSWAPRFNKPR